jgi:Lon protease-like protein
MADDGTLLPLFPIPDFVHFPRTDLKIHVAEPRFRRLVRDVADQEDDEERQIGVVLIKPGWNGDPVAGLPEVFPGGTAGRLVDVEFLPDGRANILLRGEYRFELTRELSAHPYPRGLVRPIVEPELNEEDAGIQVVRGGLLESARALAGELGQGFPLSADEVEELAGWCGFEELVNRLAVELDLPALRKLQLLIESLPERALSVLSILRSRRQVVDLLRPYRHLAGGAQLN